MSALLNSILLNALVATALAVVVWVTGTIPAVRRRPGLRHGLWIVVLLKLVTPPLFELPILPGWLVANPAPMLHAKAIPLDSLPTVSSVPSGDLRPELRPLAASMAAGSDWLSIAALVSGLGTLTVLTFATGQIWRLRRALRGGATNDERLGRLGSMMAERMGLPVVPTVCVVAANVSPLLWVRRSGPLIVIPRRLAGQLTDEQLGCVISHEIAHYLRRDHWTNLLSLMVAAVCWWNPVAWWARRELRMAQEACCDALVISRAIASRRRYAETLLQALEFIQTERSLLPALASGFGGKSSTERRFEMIANTRVSHRLSWRNYALLIAALAVLPCLLTFTEAQEVVPVDLTDVAAGDAAGGSEAVSSTGGGAKPRETDRRIYRVQDSDGGLVVLAFDKESKRLAWSSEIELTQPNQAVADRRWYENRRWYETDHERELAQPTHAVASQRFLLHTGGGVVTIAVVEGDKSLKVQELDAESGKVASECQLVGPPQDRLREAEQKQFNEGLRMPKFPMSAEDRQALLTYLKQLNEGLRKSQFPMSGEERKALNTFLPPRNQQQNRVDSYLMEFDRQAQILAEQEQERSERELLKALTQFDEVLKRIKEDKGNKRDQEGEGYRSGKSFHRAPVWRTHRTPSRQGRGATRGRPPSGDRGGSRNRSEISTHCSSVRYGFGAVLDPVRLQPRTGHKHRVSSMSEPP